MYQEENKQSQNAGAKYQRKFVIGDGNYMNPGYFILAVTGLKP